MASLLLRGFLLGFAVAASPGPVFFLCLRRSLVQGRLHGLFSGLGVATADAFYAGIATFGVAALTASLASGRRPLALAGGAVLVALGLRVLLERPHEAPARAPTARGLAWAYLSTLGITVTNPATIVSFAALAATLGLGTVGSWSRPASVVVGVLLGSASWWCILALGVSALRTRVTPRVLRGISLLSGVAIVALGLLAGYTALV